MENLEALKNTKPSLKMIIVIFFMLLSFLIFYIFNRYTFDLILPFLISQIIICALFAILHFYNRDTSRVIADIVFLLKREQVANYKLNETRSKLELANKKNIELLESIREAFFSLDHNWQFTYANMQAEQIYGKKLHEMIGKQIWELFPKLCGTEIEACYRNSAETREIVRVELLGVLTDKWYELNVYPSAEGISVFVRDIQDRKMAEATLRANRDSANEANRTKNQFLANMSHEIRTPLGVILGFTDFLADTNRSKIERDSCIKTIRRNGALLERLIADLLDLAKVEADALDIEMQSVGLHEFLRDMEVVLKFQAQEKGIELFLSTDGSIPEIAWIDVIRFKQILYNVVGNAIKYTEVGRVTVHFKTSPIEKSPGKIKFEVLVQDTGIGIPEDSQKTLFSPFIQGDSSLTRRYGGAGLGLALSKKIAKLHHGDINLVRSMEGKGSLFQIYIEAGIQEAEQVVIHNTKKIATRIAESGSENVLAKEGILEGKKILLVEDSQDNQLLLSLFLKNSGAEVFLADDGQKCLEMVQKDEFDLILMDIQMPVLDGYQATLCLRNQSFTKPIIALTAHAMKGEREKILMTGFNDYLSKPVNRNDLLNSIVSFV